MLEVERVFERLSKVACREPVPDNIREEARNMNEDPSGEPGVMSEREKTDTRSDARS
jgi:hypothetical protein